MDVDRREFSLGLILALTAACSTGNTSRAEPVHGGWWSTYRQRFLDPSGRIIDTGNGGISHSEGQGYGMILAALSEDRDAFAAMARWAESTLAEPDTGLHAWRYDPRSPTPVADPNNATDGDVLIAWALALAGKRWKMGIYSDHSAALRGAIRQHCVVEQNGQSLLLPGRLGFVNGAEITVNPSYYVWPALDTFARLDGKAAWQRVIASGEELLRQARFGPSQLPPDWVAVTPGAVAPARNKPPRFGYDAIRVPLYAVLGHRASLAAGAIGWWRNLVAQHQPIPAWIDVVTGETAPYPVSNGGAAIVARVTDTPAPTQLDSDYFAASLQMLSKARV